MKGIVFITGFCFCLQLSGQTDSVQKHTATLLHLNSKVMLRGYIYAGTNIVDTNAPGGFASSNNLPKKKDQLNLQFPIPAGQRLWIDTTTTFPFFEKFKGYKLYMVNSSGVIESYPASDGRLPVIAEVFIDHSWKPVEYLPSSWCGNSYHQVFLSPGEYWQFIIPAYSGKKKVKLRYKLIGAQNIEVYSNEISASVNMSQLSRKQGHQPNDLMDPYVD
jgi:hypothetical protein